MMTKMGNRKGGGMKEEGGICQTRSPLFFCLYSADAALEREKPLKKYTKIRRPLGDHRRVRCFPLPKPLPREPGPVDLEGGGVPGRGGHPRQK